MSTLLSPPFWNFDLDAVLLDMPIIGRGGDDARGLVNNGRARQQQLSSVKTNRRENRAEDEDSGVVLTTSASTATVARNKEIEKLREDSERLRRQYEEWERRMGSDKGVDGPRAQQVQVFRRNGGSSVGVGEHDKENYSQVRGEEKRRNVQFTEYKPTTEVKYEEQLEGNLDKDDFRFEMVFDLKGLGKRKRGDSVMFDGRNEESPEIKKVVVSFESSTEFKIVFEGEKSKKRMVLGEN